MTLDATTGLKWYPVFLFSTTVHEAAHAWTALKLGVIVPPISWVRKFFKKLSYPRAA